MKNANKIFTVINRSLIWVLLISLSISSAFAQGPTDLPDEPVDGGVPAAPIDDYVWFLAVLAITFAIVQFRVVYKQNHSSKV